MTSQEKQAKGRRDSFAEPSSPAYNQEGNQARDQAVIEHSHRVECSRSSLTLLFFPLLPQPESTPNQPLLLPSPKYTPQIIRPANPQFIQILHPVARHRILAR